MTQATITLAAQDKTASAFASVRQRFAGLSADASQVGQALSGIGVQFSAALIGAGLLTMVKSSADALDKLNDLSDATGASVAKLSGLEAIALRTGTSMDEVGAALIKVNQALNQSDTSDVAQVLQAIGLSAEELRRQDPVDALLSISTALDAFRESGNRSRAELLLFGRSLASIAPQLRDYAEAGEVAATATKAQTDQAEKFKRNLFALNATVTQAGRTIFNEAAPAFNALAESFARTGEGAAGLNVAAAGVRVVIETLAVVGAYVADTFRGVGREIGAISAQLVSLARFDFQGFTAISDALKEDNQRAKVELDRFVQSVLGANAKAAGAAASGERKPDFPAGVGTTGGGKAGAIRAQVSEYDKYIAKLQESILQTADLSAAEQARIDINKGLLGLLNDSQKSQIIGLATSLDSVKALQEAEKQAAAIAERGRAFAQRFATGQERQAALLQEADDLVAKGAITWQTYGRVATTALQESIEELAKVAGSVPKLAEPFEQISIFSEQAARNIQDTLGDSVEQALSGNFRDIGKLWASTLQKMVAQAAASKLNSYLFGDSFGAAGGSLGGIVGSLFAGSLFGGPRAEGGPVSAGRAYLVGERGPELVVPRFDGTVLPNGVGMGGSVTINQTINVGQGVSRGEVYAAAMQAKDAAKAEIMQTLYRTGRGS